MSVLVGLLVGGAIAIGLWLGLRDTFSAPVFARQNHRGRPVPVGAGIILALTVLATAAVERALAAVGVDQGVLRAGDLVLVAAAVLGLLGLFDDLGASGDDRGFRGHLRALARGRLTTGGVKLVGGGLLAVAVTAPIDADRPGRLLVDALLVALAANLANLLDRAPGRATKGGLLVAALLLGTHLDPAPAGVAVVVGASLGLLAFDLGERLMLGDAGANVLGGVLGLGVVLACSFPVRVVALAVVLVLNLASEVVSFSDVIARVPPLRALDELGRKRRR